jgi:hypothetical protein
MGQDKTGASSFAAGHFEFLIDGHNSIAILKNVDGGWVKAALIEEAVGPDLERIKHTSTVEIEPFSVEFGLAGAEDILKWIQQSWRKQWGRRSGQLTHANFDLYQTFEHEFRDALILETTFPTLDGASKEPAYLKIKVQPEFVSTKRSSMPTKRVTPVDGTKQKMWLANSFRFTIDGLDDMQYTNKIESFTIKQSVKKWWTGADRFPQIEPTKLEFPNISGTISLPYADRLLKWYDDAIVKGMKDSRSQKHGSIEFLSPNRKDTIFAIQLFHVGIVHAAVQPSTANQDQIKRVKFELHVGSMEIDGRLGFG